jgi:type II secretory pathway component HofQ
VDLQFQDGDLQDVFRLFADISGLNVVVQPGTRGLVTYHGSQVPWDEVLERLLAPNGLVARLEGNVLWIGRAAEAGEKRPFKGTPISFEFVGKELVEALREIAAHGRASVEVADGVMGKVTLKLNDVPWDQAFDLLVRVNGLAWTRTGDVIRVELQRRPPSR